MKDNGYKTCLLGKNHLVDWNLHKVWFDMTSRWDSPEWKNLPKEFEITDNPDLRKCISRGKSRMTTIIVCFPIPSRQLAKNSSIPTRMNRFSPL